MAPFDILQAPSDAKHRIGTAWLLLLAVASIALWRISENISLRLGPDSELMLQAATVMIRASEVIRNEKLSRGLLQGRNLDPNQTGLIGPEWSETMTTVGSLQAKRTLTNPDAAALLARLFRKANLHAGDPVGVILSGSFVGGNVAVLSALESYGLRPSVISSLGASMYGAADPTFTWLDMEAAVRAKGVWRIQSTWASLGGEAGMAKDLGEEAHRALDAAVRRSGVPLIEGRTFGDAVRESAAVLGLASNANTKAAAKPGLLINVGGAQLALGECPEAADIPPGLITRPVSCSQGTPGLVQIALDHGIPVLNIFKVKELAQHYGLPLDPVPLPAPGRNPFIYAR
jgi:poly-gamma-glutamate system protein